MFIKEKSFAAVISPKIALIYESSEEKASTIHHADPEYNPGSNLAGYSPVRSVTMQKGKIC